MADIEELKTIVMKRVDTDNDGKISKKELTSFFVVPAAEDWRTQWFDRKTWETPLFNWSLAAKPYTYFLEKMTRLAKIGWNVPFFGSYKLNVIL